MFHTLFSKVNFETIECILITSVNIPYSNTIVYSRSFNVRCPQLLISKQTTGHQKSFYGLETRKGFQDDQGHVQ